MWREIGAVRKEVFREIDLHIGYGLMFIDLDASLVNVHSQNKHKAAGSV